LDVETHPTYPDEVPDQQQGDEPPSRVFNRLPEEIASGRTDASYFRGVTNLALYNTSSIQGITLNTERRENIFFLKDYDREVADQETTAESPAGTNFDRHVVSAMTGTYMQLINMRRQLRHSTLTPTPAMAHRINELMEILFELFRQGFTSAQVLQTLDWDLHPVCFLPLTHTAGSVFSLW